MLQYRPPKPRSLHPYVSLFYLRTKLESNMQQLEGYDELYNSLSTWVKDTEVNLRSEAGLKPDVEQKQRQLETFKVRV